MKDALRVKRQETLLVSSKSRESFQCLDLFVSSEAQSSQGVAVPWTSKVLPLSKPNLFTTVKLQRLDDVLKRSQPKNFQQISHRLKFTFTE